MLFFKTPPRVHGVEEMDSENLDECRSLEIQDGLERINRISKIAKNVELAISSFFNKSSERLHVLDIACGGGDITRSIACRMSHKVSIDGCDRNYCSIQSAKTKAEHLSLDSKFFVFDALKDEIPAYDLIICSQFLHHLNFDQAVLLMRRFACATRLGFIVLDINRFFGSTTLFYLGTSCLTGSQILRDDAYISAMSAYTPQEALQIVNSAGLTGATVHTLFPFRWTLTWRK